MIRIHAERDSDMFVMKIYQNQTRATFVVVILPLTVLKDHLMNYLV